MSDKTQVKNLSRRVEDLLAENERLEKELTEAILEKPICDYCSRIKEENRQLIEMLHGTMRQNFDLVTRLRVVYRIQNQIHDALKTKCAKGE
ncbi:MAG TPA: hypothetical protein VLH56_08615 [Dissulfurispiraceae bacterium]|nr:hypothetical protein [Dissulfurispiraceae bacterium]